MFLSRAAPAAVAALAVAFAWPMQGAGFNQNAHYALVRALADGTPRIDETRGEVGELGTLDVHRYRGHWYSDKAPGLAFAALPAFLALEAVGVSTSGDTPTHDPTRMLWALGLLATVLPAVGLVALVAVVGDRLAPRYGIAAAVTLGVATLLLPFSGLFFSHALSAFAAFAAFALLFFERAGPPRPWLVAAAGVVAGVAVVVEYPNAIVAAVLTAYALARAGRLRRAAAYAGGVLLGLAPLGAYDLWAFGSVTRLSYAGGLEEAPGGTVFGLDAPRPRVMLELLFSSLGLVVWTPIVVAAAIGITVLYRRGRRAEALVFGGLPLLFVAYNSGYFAAFGGLGPPRYLVSALGFLAVPLALAYRSLPATTLSLALVSALVVVSSTATYALASYDGDWFDRLAGGDFPFTAARLVGVTGWYAMLPFFAAVLVAVVLAAAAVDRAAVASRDVALGGAAVLTWAFLAATAPRAFDLGGRGREYAAYWGVGLVAALGAGVALAAARLRPLRSWRT